MFTRRHLLSSAVAVPAALPISLLSIDRSQAQVIDLLKILVPAAPGGGWDRTARTIEQVLRDRRGEGRADHQRGRRGRHGRAAAVPQPVEGAGQCPDGCRHGDGRGDHRQQEPGQAFSGDADRTAHRRVPALVVPAQSALRNVKEFAAALKADPKVPVAGGSAGGSDHILLGMIAKALGVSPTRVSYVAYAGGGPAVASLLGNQVAAGISGIGEFAEQIKAGKLGLIAISADQRQPAIDAPTLKEEGIDVELFNWRGVFAPPGVNDGQRKAMIDLVEKMAASPQWAEACQKRDWTRSRSPAMPSRHTSTARPFASKGFSGSGSRDMTGGEIGRGVGAAPPPARRSSGSGCSRSPVSSTGRPRSFRCRRSTPRSGRPSYRSSPRSLWRCSACCCWWRPGAAAGSRRRSRRSPSTVWRSPGSPPA